MEATKTTITRTAVILVLIGVGLSSRLLEHPINFHAIGAIALFSGYYFASRRYAWLVPMAAMLISSIIIGGYDFWQMAVVNVAIVLPAFFGQMLRREIKSENRLVRTLLSAGRLVALSLAGTLAFFLVSNLAVFAFSGMYAHSVEGLVTCFVMALPFHQQDQSMFLLTHSMAGDLFYNGLLFGAHALAVLQIRRQAIVTADANS